MLQKQHVAVNAFNTLVIVRLGGEAFSFEFDQALQIAAEMKYQARVAKLSTGNHERGIYCLGVLSDAEAKVRRPFKMIRVPQLLLAKAIRLGTEGALVTLTVKGRTAKLDWASARELSQWIRIRGKEAKRNAGEAGHWSKFIKEA
jgi:hypothetical protein